MHFIEHIIEPSHLYLAWQSRSEQHRNRFIVGELKRDELGEITLRYFLSSKDLEDAKSLGFDGYPAFRAMDKVHINVLDSFLRRIPPRTRGDFAEYLEGFRLRPDVQLSDFALLGYSGAKLLSDCFSLIHPFDNVSGPCEILMEVAGFRHHLININKDIVVGKTVSFDIEFNDVIKERAVCIKYDSQVVGYVNRGLKDTFIDWINSNRIESAFVEKVNGTAQRPALYVFVKIKGK